jgi:hypothetical protein
MALRITGFPDDGQNPETEWFWRKFLLLWNLQAQSLSSPQNQLDITTTTTTSATITAAATATATTY